jgi:RNA polymerase sigma-70 factor (ECF subfamily)
LLEKNGVASARSERGRFRAFLITSLRNFLTNEHERKQAIKRGGGQRLLSLDFDSGETRLNREPTDTLTPERLFERQWTLTLLEHVLHRLESEMTASGKSRQFDVLKPFLAGAEAGKSYGDAAAQLEITEEAARQAVHRLRTRYREILRWEVARTVADPADVEDEIRGLLASLAD